jgi:hypothetical protein
MATPSLPQSNPTEDDNLVTSSQGKKRRRGWSDFRYLLREIRYMDSVGSNGYKVLMDQCSTASNFLERRTKIQRRPEHSLGAAVIVVSLQKGLITEDEWENRLRYLHLSDPEWHKEIGALFEQIMGYAPDPSSNEAIQADATDVWSLVKLPYTERQMEQLSKGYKDLYKNLSHLSMREREEYWRQPLRFDGESRLVTKDIPPKPTAHSYTAPTPPAQPQSNDDGLLLLTLALIARLTDRLKDKEPAHTVKAEPAKQEPINPEQVDADDQDRIDAVAAELLDSIEWGAI